MNYNIKGTDVTVTDELRAYVEKKLASFDKLIDNDAARADVIVSYLESEEKQHTAEMTLHDTKFPLHVQSSGKTMYEAIDAAAGELGDALNDAKKKLKDVARHDALTGKEILHENEEV